MKKIKLLLLKETLVLLAKHHSTGNTEYHLYEIKMRRRGTKRVKGRKEWRVGNDERSDKRREGKKEEGKGLGWSR